MALESSTLHEYVQRALQATTQNPVIAFPANADTFNGFVHYTLPDLKNLADQAAAQYVSQGLKPRQRGGRPKVVGVLAAGDIDWFVTFLAIIRMGHTLFGKSHSA